MTFDEFMRGYEEYKQQRGAGGNSGAAAQWNGRGGASPRYDGGSAGTQWNGRGDASGYGGETGYGGGTGYGSGQSSGQGISFEDFMEGFYQQNPDRRPGAARTTQAARPAQDNGRGISFEDFMEGFYQQYPDRRPATSIPAGTAGATAPASTGMALGGGVSSTQGGNAASSQQAAVSTASGTRRPMTRAEYLALQSSASPDPGSQRAQAQARYNALQPSASQADAPAATEEEQQARTRQLLAGLNWKDRPDALATARAESDWTAQSALAAAQQASALRPSVRAAATEKEQRAQQAAGSGRIPGFSPEGRAAMYAARDQKWEQNHVGYALEYMLPEYLWNGLTGGIRSAANGAAGLMAGAAGRQGATQDPGIQVMLDTMEPDATARRQELMAQAAEGAQQTINQWVKKNTEKAEEESEDLAQRFEGKEGAAANLARRVGAGAGSMAPQIVAGAIGGPAASGALIFGQGMGDYYADALKDGATTGQAVAAGIVGGAANYGIEKAFGGIPLVGEGVVPVDDVIKRYVRSRAGRMVLNRLAEATGEGAEEVLENYLKPIVQNMTYDKEIEWPTMEEQLDSFAGGFAASLVTGTFLEDMPDQYRAQQAGASLRASEGGVDSIMRRAREIYGNEETRRTLAGRRAGELLPIYEKSGAEGISDAKLGELAMELQALDNSAPGAAAGAQQSGAGAQAAAGVQIAPQTAPEAAQTMQTGTGETGLQSPAEAAQGGAAGVQPANAAARMLIPGINIDLSGALVGDIARQSAVQSGRVAEGELEAIDRMAEAKGLHVRYLYQPKSRVDGWISGNTINVNLANESSAFGVAVHEAGNAIKAADAARFAQFEQAVLRLASQDAELGRYAQTVRAAYMAQNSPARASLMRANGQINETALNEEVALKLAEQLAGDPEKMTEAVTKERGIGAALLDFIRGIKNSIAIRLTGSQKAMLDEAERTLVNLLRGEAGSVEGERLSVQTDEDGRNYVHVDTEQGIFEGKNINECVRIARKYIKNHFQNMVLPVGEDWAFINGNSADEYAYPANHRMDADVKRAKMRASTELDNLLSTSTYLRHEPDDGRHSGATGGWDVYQTIFEIDGQWFTGEVKVMNTNRGRLFYDVTKIEKIARIDEHPTSRMGDTTSDFQQGQPAVINLRETQAPHRTDPASSGAISRARTGETNPATEGDAALYTSVAQDENAVNAEKTGGQKNSLSVPYRTQQGKTLREYLREQYPGMIWPAADAGNRTAGTDPNAQAILNTMLGAGQARAAATNPNTQALVNAMLGVQDGTQGNGRAGTLPREDGMPQTENQDMAAPGTSLKASAKSLEIQKRQTGEFVDKVSNVLGVPRWAKREFLRPVAQELAETIKTTGSIDQAKADELFEKAYEQGIVIQDEMVQQYGDLKKELRQTPLTLDRETREGKSYQELRKRMFGSLNLTEDGVPVDTYYQELCEQYPELFDAGITHPADQIERIYEVYKSIHTQEVNLDAYYGDDADDFKAWARDEFDRALETMTDGVYKVRRLEMDNAAAAAIAQEEIPPMSYAEVERIQHEAKALQRKADRVMSRAALTEGDKDLVKKLLRGDTSEEFLRSKGQENLEDILRVYKARKAAEDARKPVRAYNEKIRQRRAARAVMALEGTESWTDKKTGLQYSMETMQRNIRDISHKDAAGRRMVEEYFAPVQVHEAAATRMKNEVRAKIRKLGLNQWESAYTQIYGELEALEDVPRKANEREHLTQALEELMEKHGSKINEKKARDAVPIFRETFDELFRKANQAYVENGYEPIEYRKGYFPHFSDDKVDSLIQNMAALVGKGAKPDELPTSIAGLTAGFKPGRRWNPHGLEREGYTTAYDALKGMDLYLEVTADVIHHTSDIRNLRALAEAIRYKYGDERIKEKIRKIRANEDMTDAERDEELTNIRNLGKSHLSNFVQELDEYTNLLAGKKSQFDRWMERWFGRAAYRVMGQIENRVAANMVAVNPGSWLTNYIPVAQVAAEVGQGNMLRAARDVAKNWWHDDGFTDRSDFLTNREGSTMLSRNRLQRWSDFFSRPMQWIDSFASGMVTRAYYYKNLRDGMGSVEAIQNADRQAANLMADRSKGALPTIFGSKNPLMRLFTMYQVEVNNTLRHIAKDVPDMGKKTSGIWGMILIGLICSYGLIYSYLYNDLYEKFTGRRAALDPLDILNEAMGDFAGVEVPNLIDEGGRLLRGEASIEDFKTEPKGTAEAIINTAGNLAQEVPFVGGLLGGGRLPISAALPDMGNIASNVGGLLDGDKAGRQALYGIGRELAKPAFYVGMPIGGGQFKKTAEGLVTMIQGGYYRHGKDGKELQTAVDTGNPLKWLQAAAFGRSAIPEVGEYYDSGRRGLTAEQTALIKEWGMTPTEGQQWMETFGGRGDKTDRSNYYEVRFGEEAADLDARLARMAADGATGVLPSEPDRTLTADGEKIELGAQEYKEYLETRAAGSYELLGYLPELESAGADDALQVGYAKKVQEYMAEVAKEEAAGIAPKPWAEAAREYAGTDGGEVNNRLANAILARVIISAAKADKQPNGSSIKGSRKRNALAALEAVGFDTATAAELWEMFG